MAMVEPAFLAVTSTPSMAPSSAELTWPASAAAPCANDGSAPAARTKVRQTLASSALRIRIFKSSLGDIVGAGAAVGEPSPGEPAERDLFNATQDKARDASPQCRS